MGEPVTQGQFFERMTQLEDKMQDYHRRGREHVDAQSEKILRALAVHEVADLAVANRVTIIETERGIEKSTASRHGAIAGTIVAGLVIGLFESIKKLAGH